MDEIPWFRFIRSINELILNSKLTLNRWSLIIETYNILNRIRVYQHWRSLNWLLNWFHRAIYRWECFLFWDGSNWRSLWPWAIGVRMWRNRLRVGERLSGGVSLLHDGGGWSEDGSGGEVSPIGVKFSWIDAGIAFQSEITDHHRNIQESPPPHNNPDISHQKPSFLFLSTKTEIIIKKNVYYYYY